MDDGGGGDNWTTGAISRGKLQSNHHHKPTTSFFTGRMPILSPNQQCQSTEGKKWSGDVLVPANPGPPGNGCKNGERESTNKYFPFSYLNHDQSSFELVEPVSDSCSLMQNMNETKVDFE